MASLKLVADSMPPQLSLKTYPTESNPKSEFLLNKQYAIRKQKISIGLAYRTANGVSFVFKDVSVLNDDSGR